MRIGTLAWVSGWVSITVLLATIAWAVGPGAIGGTDEPVTMVRIAGGTFPMGAEGDIFDERPAHMVTVRTFEMDTVPVTNARFAGFLNTRGGVESPQGLVYDLSDRPAKIWRVGERFTTEPGFEQHPVVAVPWQGARSFCEWRGGRLPTEAEWERAARGAEGRAYPWGNEPPDSSRARYGVRLFDYVAVGSYPAGATPEGLLDMAGNVWQWTDSLYRPYPYVPDDGRENPKAVGERVTRGGGQTATPDMLRATYRNVGLAQTPPGGRPPVTFRCVRDAD
ncbi:MAG: SUMF1/EgtB/PvdO family nonheme iron enzyme [Chloroflexi bacterium]|nr:SUMF1/EgtB/PvdO family nonheme iron enzyme [Chloroflexota bacterium]